jgi:integrase/recombinase XerD
MKELLLEFIAYLRSKKTLSENTLESYSRDVQQYIDFLGTQNIIDIRQAPYDIFTAYIKEQQSAGRAPTTINRSMASVRVFYRYLMMEAIVSVNPTIGIESPKIDRKKPGYLSQDEVRILLDQPVKSGPKSGLKGVRDKGMMELVYASGIRVHELIALNTADLDMKNNILRCGEPGSDRYIPIDSQCMKPMGSYLEEARPYMMRDRNENALFINTNGGRLSRQGFWKIIKQYAQQAGINKDITPHMLRQALAVHLLQKGRSPDEVKALLGRADLTSLVEFIPGGKSAK